MTAIFFALWGLRSLTRMEAKNAASLVGFTNAYNLPDTLFFVAFAGPRIFLGIVEKSKILQEEYLVFNRVIKN